MKKISAKLLLLFLVFALVTITVSAQCTDEDSDGYGVNNDSSCLYSGYDCNDFDPTVNPGATEVCDDSIDNNCNGQIDADDDACGPCEDKDHDGFSVATVSNADCGVEDCDDTNALINPDADEIAGDDIDNNCDGEVDETGTGKCVITYIGWIDCEGNEVSSADEGDGVYLGLTTRGCDANAQITFYILEDTEDVQIETIPAKFLKIDGAKKYWMSYWLARYLEDVNDPNSPEPEYYIEVSVNDPLSGKTLSGSGRNHLLTVNRCPSDDPECGEECTNVPPAGFDVLGAGGGSSTSSSLGGLASRIQPECLPEWDCSDARWSECDPATHKMIRDVSLCRFKGIGNQECAERSRSTLPTVKDCSSYIQVLEVPQSKKSVCGDGICSSTEKNTGSCPQDCSVELTGKSFPWLAVILATILIAALIGGALFGYQYWKKKKILAAKVSPSPFTSKTDETAVINYIKNSKLQGVPDQYIIEALKKSGWKEDQVSYAFKKVAENAANKKP